VPAKSYKATLFDRIFTRIGAQDNILVNKSTFFLEMEETGTVLQQATASSLVILDELGRGTSTFDGYALAKAVLNFLVRHELGLVLFTTHYKWLVSDFKDSAEVGLWTMASRKEGDGIRFIYKFVPGVAESSFGMCVGRMAGIPKRVLDSAERKSTEFTETFDKVFVN